jgi:hypothetical protein
VVQGQLTQQAQAPLAKVLRVARAQALNLTLPVAVAVRVKRVALQLKLQALIQAREVAQAVTVWPHPSQEHPLITVVVVVVAYMG